MMKEPHKPVSHINFKNSLSPQFLILSNISITHITKDILISAKQVYNGYAQWTTEGEGIMKVNNEVQDIINQE